MIKQNITLTTLHGMIMAIGTVHTYVHSTLSGNVCICACFCFPDFHSLRMCVLSLCTYER